MAQVTEVYTDKGKLLGYVHLSELTGKWRAVSLDGWIVYCASQAEAEAALKEGRRV